MSEATDSPENAEQFHETESEPIKDLPEEERLLGPQPGDDAAAPVANHAANAADAPAAQHVTDPATALIVVPPDGGWGWVIVAASFVCNFFVDGITYCFGVFLNDIAKDLQAEIPEVSVAASFLSGFYLLAGPFVSALTNKYGFRCITIVGTILASSGFVLSSYSSSVGGLLFFYGIMGGIGFGLIYVPSVLIVGFYFEKWRALTTGIAVCGSGIGMLALAPISAKLVAKFGWRWTFCIHGALLSLCGISGLLFRPLAPVQVTVEPGDDEQAPPPKALNTIKNGYPTAAEYLQMSKSTQSLSPSVFMAAALTKTQSVPMIPLRKRTMSETSAVGTRTRRGTECVVRSRRGTITKVDDTAMVNRPLYRDDIFFSGSLYRLPDYNSSQRDFMGYTLSVTRLPTHKDLQEEEECNFCPEAVTRALANLFDTSLLKYPSFLLLCTSAFLTVMGVFVPSIYIQQRGRENGLDESQIDLLLFVVGVTNTVGRVVCGVLSNLPCTDAVVISSVALSIGGIATMVSHLSYTPFYQFSYCAVYGFALACFGSLRSILVVDLVGIEKLTNAFGILLLFQGVAAVLGPPIAGIVREATGHYSMSFMLAGGSILLSGLVLIPLKAVSRWEGRTKENKDETIV